MFNRVALILLCCLSISAQVKGETRTGDSWYDGKNKGHVGWYGYEPEKKEEEKIVEGEPPPTQSPHPEQIPEKITEWPTYDEAMNMRPEELGRYLKESGAEAFKNPEDEAMMLRWTQYMTVTRVKSEEFAMAHAYVTLQHPELVYQEATDVVPGMQAMNAQKWQSRSDYLKSRADSFGLMLFTQHENALNEPMENILRGFQSYFDWDYRVVDVDENPVLAQIVGVTKIPQIFLISIDNQFDPVLVVTGPTTSLSLAETVYNVMHVKLDGRSIKDFAEPVQTVTDFTGGN